METKTWQLAGQLFSFSIISHQERSAGSVIKCTRGVERSKRCRLHKTTFNYSPRDVCALNCTRGRFSLSRAPFFSLHLCILPQKPAKARWMRTGCKECQGAQLAQRPDKGTLISDLHMQFKQRLQLNPHRSTAAKILLPQQDKSSLERDWIRIEFCFTSCAWIGSHFETTVQTLFKLTFTGPAVPRYCSSPSVFELCLVLLFNTFCVWKGSDHFSLQCCNTYKIFWIIYTQGDIEEI